MRIGEVAARAGVNVETLRYYERRGLLPEPARTPAGHRSYDDEAVRFVRAVREAQGLGFTLGEIEELLRAARRPGRAPEKLRVRLAAKLDEIDAKVASLRRVREEIGHVLGCACDSLDRCTCGAGYLARGGTSAKLPAGAPLHVTNGDSVVITLRRTALGGATLAWRDVLCEGPLPLVPPAEFRAVRARFLADAGWGSADALRHDMEQRDATVLAALRERRPVVLWFEHDLYDQLQLLQVLAFVAEEGGAVELIQADRFLGELPAEQLEALWPTRTPVTDEQLELAVAAWDAVRSDAVAEFLERDAAALPCLAPALRRLLENRPRPDGLTRSERQLLEPLRDGAKTPFELFLASQAAEEAAFDGDAWAFARIARLAGLLATENGSRLPQPPPRGDHRAFVATRLVLTDEGRRALAG